MVARINAKTAGRARRPRSPISLIYRGRAIAIGSPDELKARGEPRAL